MRDPVVEEVRRIREEHAAKFDYDLDAIFADLKREESESGRSRVHLSPRPAAQPDGQVEHTQGR